MASGEAAYNLELEPLVGQLGTMSAKIFIEYELVDSEHISNLCEPKAFVCMATGKGLRR